MKGRKLMALILSLSLLVSAFPATIFAAETENNNGEGAESAVLDNLFLDKTAELMDDGTYTINLEAYATGTTITKTVTEGVPLDVVLVMDQSGSLVDPQDLLTQLKESVTSFLASLQANGEEYGVNHRVAICGFASHSMQSNSGLAGDGYSYANDIRDNAWTNTGIFVNGEFLDYGTVEYIPVESAGSMSTSKYYVIDCYSTDEEILEKTMTYYSGGKWCVSTKNEDGYLVVADTTQELLDKFNVYTVGNSLNLLNDTDYAAAWENIAAGENGQGGINPDITEAVSHLSGNGATATFMGLKMARKMLENLPAETDGVARKKIVIVFTDGEPGPNGYAVGDAYAALAEADKIKAGSTEIYTIGIYSEASASAVETFMSRMSSNYGDLTYSTTPSTLDMSVIRVNSSNSGYVGASSSGQMYYYRGIDGTNYGISPYYIKEGDNYWPVCIRYDVSSGSYYARYISDDGEYSIPSPNEAKYYQLNTITPKSTDYYMFDSDISKLSGIFETITSDMTGFTSELSLDANAVLKDVLAEGFTLTNKSTITVSVVPGSMSGETITWGKAQQVLSFNYPATTEASRNVVVNGAADRTEMTLTAKATEDGIVTVTGFNYASAEDANQVNAQYISAGHPGSKLVVTITGVEATTEVVTDSLISTNKGTSGIYEGANADADGDGEKGELQAAFPLPTTYLPSQVYVLDYAKPITFAVSDFLMKNGISIDDADVDGYHYVDAAATAITKAYGKVAMADNEISYEPTNMNWHGYDTFYVFGTTDNETVKSATANKNGNMWAKVSVIPANNVYYEDTFVTSEEAGTVGIIYSADGWQEVDANDAPAEGGNQGEHPESDENAEGNNQGGVHGWEDTLADDKNFSDGSAHVAGTNDTVGATAVFTFTGTGVDIYSRTNKETGIVLAMLYEGSSTTDAEGKNLVAKYSIMVDHLAASGDYFQVPTLSLSKIPLKVDGQIQKDPDGNTIMTDLPYGTYTVKLLVTKANTAQTDSERFLYYLDGIRVYNPIRNQEKDSVVSGAYGEAELNATFVEIRDKLLDANSFSAGEDVSDGPVFIDRITAENGEHTDDTQTAQIGIYEIFGPKNEVYLSPGQMIAFAVEYQENAHYYIGMKSLTGDTVAAKLYNAEGTLSQVEIGHTTDLYYEVFPVAKTDENGNTIYIISVEAANVGAVPADGTDEGQTDEQTILSLTKLKATGPAMNTYRFARVRNADLLSYAAAAYGSANPDGQHPGPEEEPGEPAEPSEPSEPTPPEVDVDNPDSDSSDDTQSALQKLMLELLERIFSDLRGWFRP